MNGNNILTWDWFYQKIKSSTCLTKKGQEVGCWAIRQLEAFLGKDWPDMLKRKNHILFSQYWCPWNDIPTVFYNIFKLAALVALLKNAANFNKLKKGMRRNHDHFYWIHSLLQLEVAGLGLRHEWDCEFEPELTDNRRADLLFRSKRDEKILFEIVSMGMDIESVNTTRCFDEISARLMRIGLEKGVSFKGNIGIKKIGAGNRDEFELWLQKIESAAEEVALFGGSAIVCDPANSIVKISKDSVSPGIKSLTGPEIKKDELGRIEARIKEKTEQTKNINGVWIYLVECGGLFYFTEWAQLSLSKKLDTLVSALCDTLSCCSNISGIVISNGWGWRTSQKEKEIKMDINNIQAFAIRRFLPANIQKETLFIGNGASVAQELSQLVTWFMSESGWLDWALLELGFPQFSELCLL